MAPIGVRQRASKVRIVFLSIPPAWWRLAAVSCTAASAPLRNFLGIVCFLWSLDGDEDAIIHEFRHLVFAVVKNHRCQFTEGLQLSLFNIRLVFLFEAVDVDRALALSEEDDRA